MMVGANDAASSSHDDGVVINEGAAAKTEISSLPLLPFTKAPLPQWKFHHCCRQRKNTPLAPPPGCTAEPQH